MSQQHAGGPPVSPTSKPVQDGNDADDRPLYQRNSSTCSEADAQALEVMIEKEKVTRRKASIGDDEAAEIARQSFAQRSDVACHVHQMLADHHNQHSSFDGKRNSLTGIREIELDRRPDGKGDEGGGGSGGGVASSLTSDAVVMKTPAGGDGIPPESSTKNVVRSRMLTKKQLSDMAWGVRELSKKLGAVKLKVRVRNIFLLTKAHDESLIELTRDMTMWLLSPERDGRYTVYVEDTLRSNRKFDAAGIVAACCKDDAPAADNDSKGTGTGTGARAQPRSRLRYWNNQLARDKPDRFDFVISLGGDGTVLYASWLFQRIVPPVISFSLGSLGFLTKFDFEQYPQLLTSAFRDGVLVSLRLRFEGTVMRSQQPQPSSDQTDDNTETARRDLVEELVGTEAKNSLTHKPDGTFEILNDIVVDRGPNATMSSIELFGDDEHFTTVQADGICVATPTGSTAYNLAAGGSLCHPDNPVILVTAICAHTLSFRPIILPDTIVLRVGVPYDARTGSWASFDGRERVELRPGDYVTISASRFPFANVMPAGKREDWISSISSKLQWNVRQRQKSFKEWEKD